MNQQLIDRQIDAGVEVIMGQDFTHIRKRRSPWPTAPLNDEEFWRSCQAPPARPRRRGPDPVVVLAWLGCSVVGLLTIIGAVTAARWVLELIAGVR